MPLQSIFHPSDFSPASEIAFGHALRLALGARASLRMLHVSRDPDQETGDFPGVRATLARWKRIPEGSDKAAVAAIGLHVRKVVSHHRDPIRASLAYLEKHPSDLIVIATHPGDGRAEWLKKSAASPVARSAGGLTLFIPEGTAGFVSRDDGSITLRNVLIPMARTPAPEAAVNGCLRLARALGGPELDVTLLHVGRDEEMPRPPLPEEAGWRSKWIARPGEVVRTILSQAADPPADLIVMTTRGPHGLLDALRGSTTEQVIRHARCPLLAVPEAPPSS